MKNEQLSGQCGNGKQKRSRIVKPEEVLDLEYASINAERSGDWMPAEELWEAAKAALNEGKDVTLNLEKIEHLDASAMQILLALDAEQKKNDRHLQLVNVSSNLRNWFEYSGADAYFPMTGQKSNE